MFNELSFTQVNSISDAKSIIEIFINATIKAKEIGFTEIRLHQDSLTNLYQLILHPDYRIDNWLSDKNVNSDLQDKFKEIISTFPLIKNEDFYEKEIYEFSEFYKILDEKKWTIFGLGAAYIYGTLAVSLGTNKEWFKTTTDIYHYSLDNEGNDNTFKHNVLHFSSKETLETHLKWIENERKVILEKSIDLWDKRIEYFPNILFGTDIKNQIHNIGLSKRFNQIYECLKKLDLFAKNWTEGGFDLNKLKSQSLMNISGESAITMQKYPVLRKFPLSDGIKHQFELHIKLPDTRIYFLPDSKTFQITVGYIGKHIRTAKFD